jgi:phage terminase large subunit-like protein
MLSQTSSSNSLPGITREDLKYALQQEQIRRDPVKWIEENFYLYDTGQRIKLYECQVRPLREARRKDPQTGRFNYSTVLWSWPKKSAKSTVIAAMVDYVCSTQPLSQVRLVANDLRQADSRVGMYLRESIRVQQKRFGLRQGDKIKPSGYRVEYENGSVVEMVPIDPQGEAGGNDNIIVYSELWGWKSRAHQNMWAEMTLSPTKFGNAQRWIDTYAGYYGESPILENLYEIGVKGGHQLWDDLEVFVNEKARLLTVWVTQHLLPWQQGDAGEAYYRAEADTLTANEFLRMHKNYWISSAISFIEITWWDGCRGDIPMIKKRQEIVIGVDAGVNSDCFALAAVTRSGEILEVRYARAWIPPKGGSILFSDPNDKENLETPEGEIRRLVKQYNVVKIVYDAYQLHDMMTRLRRENVVAVSEFSQGGDRMIADKHLYDVIKGRRIVHRGEPDLRQHIQNANRIDNAETLRIVKRNASDKVDLAVALSMASYEAKRLNI